ncbi:MAG: OmpP1/FadL family transporter [Thiotrichales bacterium]
MRGQFKPAVLALAVGTLMAASGAANATNGYAMHGIGTKAKGMAGAGAAFPQDTLSMGTNPAGAVTLGGRIDAGLALFNPNRNYTVTGFPSGNPGTFGLNPRNTDSDSELFAVPEFGYNRMLGSDRSVGVAVFGNGGMNTDYPGFANMFCPPPGGTGSFCAGAAGINLSQLFITPTYAQKFAGGKASFGASLVLVYQEFEATGIGSFQQLSSDPTNLSDRGKERSTGVGVRLGVMGEVAPDVTLGATYAPKVSMSEFDKYSGLFAEQGGFDIPSNWSLALAWKTPLGGTLAFDVQGIQFSDIASVGNPLDPMTLASPMNPTGVLLGQNNGPGFGWDDMIVFKLGYQWTTSPDWTWRAGISVTDQPVASNQVLFNILAPAVVETHISAGLTKKMGPNQELSASLTHALNNSVKGSNSLEMPNQQTIELEMNQWEVSVGYSWLF